MAKDNFIGCQFHRSVDKIGEQLLNLFEDKTMIIYPAVDLIKGQCVRLVKESCSQKSTGNLLLKL